MGLIPAGPYSIKSFCEKSVTIDPSVETVLCDLIFDPQTSGGLVVSLAEKDANVCLRAMIDEGIDASIIGEVTGNHQNGHVSIV
jgi:selenide,water dikinase